MSPYSAAGADDIKVTIHSPGVGSGMPEEGGGPLRGGLTLMNRFTADIDDPAIPHEVTMVVAARDGYLVCESLRVGDGEPVTGITLRSARIGLYLQRIRRELATAAGALLVMRTSRAGNHVTYKPRDADDLREMDLAQMRRAVHTAKITPEMAAAAYREALASPDQGHRPTAAAAERLGASRGYISRLLSEARRKGIEGLGPSRPPRRKDAR